MPALQPWTMLMMDVQAKPSPQGQGRVRKSELISYVLVKQALTFFGALMMKVTQMLLT